MQNQQRQKQVSTAQICNLVYGMARLGPPSASGTPLCGTVTQLDSEIGCGCVCKIEVVIKFAILMICSDARNLNLDDPTDENQRTAVCIAQDNRADDCKI